MTKKQTLAAALVATMALADSASATILTQFEGIVSGRAAFDATVTAAGGTVAVDVWDDAVVTNPGGGIDTIERTDYDVTANDSGSLELQNAFNWNSDGLLVNIDPDSIDPSLPQRSDPLDYFNSGLTFTFDSGVNSFGFEVDDWATCCYEPVTELFISFDGGAPILVASADEAADGLFPSPDNPAVDTYAIFVSAFDDSGTFTEVSFWGNGLGEFLGAGSVIRYAAIDPGSLPGDVPIPASLLLMVAGLAGLRAARRLRG